MKLYIASSVDYSSLSWLSVLTFDYSSLSWENPLERSKLQQSAKDQLTRVFQEHNRIIMELEVQKEKLKQKEQGLKEREAHNENENLSLNYEKKQNEQAILELKRADERMLSLAEEHKREKEALQRKMIDLERELDAKQALKLEIRHLTGNLQVVKHMGADDGDEEVLEKFVAIEKELEEKEEELQDLEALSVKLLLSKSATAMMNYKKLGKN